MNAAVPFTHAQIRRAAMVATALERIREARQAPPMNLVAEAQANEAAFQQLPAHLKAVVTQHFYGVKQDIVNEVYEQEVAEQEDAFFSQAENLMKDFTKNMAGQPNGLTMETSGALRAGAKPVLRVRKLPNREQSDAIVRDGTRHLVEGGQGLSAKEYERRLLDLNSMGVHHPQYEKTAQRYFGDMPRKELNALVRDALNDSVGVELRRRNDKAKPDTRTMQALSPEERRRLDVIEAISDVESSNPDSMFHKDKNAGLRTIAHEEANTVRGAVAAAVLGAGGLDAIDLRDEYEDTDPEPVDFDESSMETDNG